MTTDEFFARLQSDLKNERGCHRVSKPVPDSQLAKWQVAHPGLKLPPEYVDFLWRANGVIPDVKDFGGEMDAQFLPIQRVTHPSVELFGKRDMDAMPASWLCIARGPESSAFILLDGKTGKYLLIAESARSEKDAQLLPDFPAVLDWFSSTAMLPPRPPAAKPPKARKTASEPCPFTLTDGPSVTDHAAATRAVAFSPDGTTALSGTWPKGETPANRTALIHWDAATGRILKRFEHVTWHHHIAFTSATTACLLFGTIQHVDLSTGEVQNSIARTYPENPVTGAFTPDGRTLVLFEDSKASLFDSATLEPQGEFPTLNDFMIFFAAIAPAKRVLIAGVRNLSLLDLPAKKVVRTLPRPPRDLTCLALSPNGRHAALGMSDGNVAILDLDGDSETKTVLPKPKGYAETTTVAYFPDGNRLVTVHDASLISLWDTANLRLLAQRKMQSSQWVSALCCSPDGQRLLLGLGDRTARILHLTPA